MSKPKILIQLDSDPHPSVFDAVVAVDSGVDRLLQYRAVEPADVRDLVHGAIFTRGPQELMNTAIFIGGSNVKAGEELLAQAESTTASEVNSSRTMRLRWVREAGSGQPPAGAATRSKRGLFTPIILSRVTTAASCSSVQPSVPAGRRGSTR